MNPAPDPVSRPSRADTTQGRTAREGTCEHCGKPIVFEPFFLDGKQPNPPIWFHPGGGRTCSTIPCGWTDPGWPRATPKETDHA